jgi:flavin reductase (DIM6/NTAB) family NADH-FMN oxidoreductase RutF
MFHAIDPKTIDKNVFTQIGEQWMLVTAGTREKCNTMTASWGGLGVLWKKNVATIYVRPQRYTYEFLEANDTFTLSFFGAHYRKALALCGSKSGRELDKIKECGFTVETAANGAPYFTQAELVMVCKKLYYHDINPAHFLDPSIESNYNQDYHRMYIGEIVEVLGE